MQLAPKGYTFLATGNDQPPKYSTQATEVDKDQILRDIVGVTSRERSAVPDFDRETEQLRNFLRFVLSIDYQSHISIKISGADKDHFLGLRNRINNLYYSHDAMTKNDRQNVAPYFWRFLHAPCASLGIPVQAATEVIHRFGKYVDHIGKYRGCVFGLLKDKGPEGLAYKLYVDRAFLVPFIFDSTDRVKMVSGLQKIERLYFERLGAPSQGVDPGNCTELWQDYDAYDFRLNERGLAYAASRNAAINEAKRSMADFRLSLVSKIKNLTAKLVRRQEAMSAYETLVLKTARVRRPTPRGWTYSQDGYMPDFFEDRAVPKRCNEA